MTEPLTSTARKYARTGVSRPLADGDNRGMDRFWSKVDSSGGPDACWPWTGQRSYMGYGLFYNDEGRRVTASRVALILSLGRDLGPRRMACHQCNNPPCCNPDHLYEGSYADNARDRTAARLARD